MGAAAETRSGDPRLEPIGADGLRQLFELRNDPFVVGLSRSGLALDWSAHVAWATHALTRPDAHRLYFLVIEGERLGVLRFDRRPPDAAEVTVYLLERATGRGHGVEAIRRGVEAIAHAWPVERVLAHVIEGNDRSRRAFARAGFGAPSAEEAAEGWTCVRRLECGSEPGEIIETDQLAMHDEGLGRGNA